MGGINVSWSFEVGLPVGLLGATLVIAGLHTPLVFWIGVALIVAAILLFSMGSRS